MTKNGTVSSVRAMGAQEFPGTDTCQRMDGGPIAIAQAGDRNPRQSFLALHRSEYKVREPPRRYVGLESFSKPIRKTGRRHRCKVSAAVSTVVTSMATSGSHRKALFPSLPLHRMERTQISQSRPKPVTLWWHDDESPPRVAVSHPTVRSYVVCVYVVVTPMPYSKYMPSHSADKSKIPSQLTIPTKLAALS